MLVAAWGGMRRAACAAAAVLLSLMYMHAKHSARAPVRPVIQLDDGSKNDLGGALGGVGWTARRTDGEAGSNGRRGTRCVIDC